MSNAVAKKKRRPGAGRPPAVRLPTAHLVLVDGKEVISRVVWAKYQAFVAGFIEHGNATKASVDAGFIAGTPGAQRDLAYRLLRIPEVAAMLLEQCKSIIAKARVTKERVEAEIARLSFSNIADCFDDAGVRKMGDIPEDAQRAIASYKTKRTVSQGEFGEIITEECEVRMASKGPALEQLIRLLGMVKDLEKDNAGELAAKFILAMQEGRRRAFIEPEPTSR